MYESHATMQFERPEKIVMVDQVMDQTPRSEIDINTYLQRLNSASLRSRVIESFTPDEIKVLQRPYLKDLPPGMNLPSAAEALGQRLCRTRAGQPHHRDHRPASRPRGRRPGRQPLLHSNSSTTCWRKAAAPTRTRSPSSRSAPRNCRRSTNRRSSGCRNTRRLHNLISLDDSLNFVTDRLKSVNAARTAAHLDRLNLEVLCQPGGRIPEGATATCSRSPTSAGHGTVPGLKAQLAEALQRQALLGERYLERHPQMIEIARTIRPSATSSTRPSSSPSRTLPPIWKKPATPSSRSIAST